MGWLSGGSDKSSDKYQASNDSNKCNHPNQGAHERTKSDGSKQIVVECGTTGPGCGMEWTN